MNLKEYRKAIAKGRTLMLVFHEKHGDRYFDVSTESRLFGACLSVLEERFKTGYWYEAPEEPEAPTLTLEAIAKLKDGAIKRSASDEHLLYDRQVSWYKEATKIYADIEKAVKTKDGALAYKCLVNHQDGEYERMNIEELKVIEYEDHK